jgi:hypothetical protein
LVFGTTLFFSVTWGGGGRGCGIFGRFLGVSGKIEEFWRSFESLGEALEVFQKL